MELIDNDKVKNDNQSTKKILTILGVLIAILIITVIGIFIYIQYLSKTMLKFNIDGKSKSSQISNVIRIENDKVYASIKDLAPLLGYTAYNGGYRQYTEDINKCYVANQQEASSFTAGSDTLYKYSINGENTDGQYYQLDESIKMIDNKLYADSQALSRAFNISVNYDKEKNQVDIYTLGYLVSAYSNVIKGAAIINTEEKELEASQASKLFENQKAVLYGYVIVKSDTTNYYGIYSASGEELVGEKYTQIQYVESTNNFIVTTAEGKVGIIASSGITQVNPIYESIQQIDKDLGLYLVSQNKKYGIINQNGKIIIHVEYDEIGIEPSKFPSNNITNRYLLYDNCIPVCKDKLWGLYSKNGSIILPLEYDGLGCEVSTLKDKSSNNVLLIPEIEGIVIEKDVKTEQNQSNNSVVKNYGIIDSTGKPVISNTLQQVYSITNEGKEEYFMTFNNTDINVIEYLEQVQKQNANNNNNNKANDANTQNQPAAQNQTNNQNNTEVQNDVSSNQNIQ